MSYAKQQITDSISGLSPGGGPLADAKGDDDDEACETGPVVIQALS